MRRQNVDPLRMLADILLVARHKAAEEEAQEVLPAIDLALRIVGNAMADEPKSDRMARH
ncbi:hypothetical protein [Aureimonas frigidaquae]|uniref:hypothetical protein n=1 Tax=Aureimonas frigidaquae TaxID=424757 RepID=UPI000B2808E8|nr:hypothetical protein [Aureimonas frigidaquae]